MGSCIQISFDKQSRVKEGPLVNVSLPRPTNLPNYKNRLTSSSPSSVRPRARSSALISDPRETGDSDAPMTGATETATTVRGKIAMFEPNETAFLHSPAGSTLSGFSCSLFRLFLN